MHLTARYVFRLAKVGLFLLFLTLFSSCIVSKKKYDELLAQKVRLDADLADRDTLLSQANKNIQSLDERVKKLSADTTSLGQDVRSASGKLAALDKEYSQLNAYYKNLLNSSGKLNRDMAQQQEQLLAIQNNLDRTRKLNDSLNVSLTEREKKVRELENIMAAKDKAVNDLKNSISNALLNFKENDLTVNVKNGKVYVSLAEQLLFASGSTEVDAKGVSALQQLAKAIKDQRDINIMVEGHTDNVPISKKTAYMQDNWDLSVMRATAITKILTKAGLAPSQVTAAGKGEYSPLAPNTTPQSKQKNRRTEIIITPNLDELFKILGTN
ncbi:MAG TPA: OmpA family protein [Cyclobacteriaceae bacterium]|nr:OmpA family protein [Cyclobacteriaceae bacterium]HMV10300.1 OmpA family protein [Cyclobacteriaceae bacterium]HMV90616.1 OmpA family protein [Cyclobacteriaceae bacterium]HMX02827.1 OmpA family protein [Cyclobacteriaceae bacterium]HMX50053.1 OmpA family protein [Cyclobacteriaceae bacterium]